MPSSAHFRLWASLRRRHKIVQELVLECEPPDVFGEGMVAVCKAFDIASPVVMTKHQRELDEFYRTSFSPKDFIEPFGYTALDLELYQDDEA